MSGNEASALHEMVSADRAVLTPGASGFSLGAMGFAAQLCLSAPNLQQALRYACASSALWCRAPFRLDVAGEYALVRTTLRVCEDSFDVVGATQFWSELAASVVGEAVAPHAVHVPGELAPTFANTLSCPLHRRQGWFGLSFGRAELERANPGEDRRLFQLLSDYLQERLAQVERAASTTQSLHNALAELDELSHASAAALAARLGLGVRTLHRRLHAEGETYRSVLDAFRRARCTRQLAGGAVSAKQVAHALGFADPAGFHRAFRRWTGCTVREWQRALGSPLHNPALTPACERDEAP